MLAIEPAGNVYITLVERCAGVCRTSSRARSPSSSCADRSSEFRPVRHRALRQRARTHRDDAAELRTAIELTRPGGALGLFVPAMPSLYGSLDYKSGHYRRYTPAAAERSGTPGFVDVSVRYFDLLGVVPVLADVPRVRRATPRVGVVDRATTECVVPLGRLLEAGDAAARRRQEPGGPRPPAGRDVGSRST